MKYAQLTSSIFSLRFLNFTVCLLLALMMTPRAEAFYVDAGQIYDDQGQVIDLHGVNWFGFETANHVPHGLWARNVNDMIAQMKSLGINAVRLPLAPNAIHGVPVNSVDYGLNPELNNKNSLQVLDYIVDALDKAGIYILLDHHRPDDNAISELWYTDGYTEQQWLNDLEFLAGRYKNVVHFLGIDLKNEPHGAATWGTGNMATDWNLAAERASNVVLASDPKALVFVEGIGNQAGCSSPENAWWGGNIAPIQCTPLTIPQDKLVLAPHVYGPDVYLQPYFNDPSFPANMPAIWNAQFGFAVDIGYTVAPTEFGSHYGHGGSAIEKTWFDALINWMEQKNIRNSFYWSWNPNSGDTGGLLEDDWQTIWPDKLAKLQELWGSSTTPLPSPTPMPSPSPSGVLTEGEYTLKNAVDNDWGTGYCATVTITNISQRAADWAVSFAFGDTLTNFWNAVLTTNGTTLSAVGDGSNHLLQPSRQTSFGYCATRQTQPAPTPDPSPAPTPDPAPTPTPDPVPEPAVVTLSPLLTKTSDWGAGYCMQVDVTNNSTQPVVWHTVVPREGIIYNVWNAKVSAFDDTQLSAQGVDWNAILSPGGTADFGYCANR